MVYYTAQLQKHFQIIKTFSIFMLRRSVTLIHILHSFGTPSFYKITLLVYESF